MDQQQVDCGVQQHSVGGRISNREIVQLYAEFNVLREYIKKHNHNHNNVQTDQNQPIEQQEQQAQHSLDQEKKQIKLFTPQVKRGKRNHHIVQSSQQENNNSPLMQSHQYQSQHLSIYPSQLQQKQQQQQHQQQQQQPVLCSPHSTRSQLIQQYTLLYKYSIKKVIQQKQRRQHKRYKHRNQSSSNKQLDDEEYSLSNKAINLNINHNNLVTEFEDAVDLAHSQYSKKQDSNIARRLTFDIQHSQMHLASSSQS